MTTRIGWLELREQGKCFNTHNDDFFIENFPPTKSGDAARRAKAICHGTEDGKPCPVLDACLAQALALTPSDDFGIWGGTTSKERKRLRKHSKAV